jgi:hypothetical protein
MYHPRQWRRVESVNAAGWILIVPVVFVRALVLIVLHGGVREPQGTVDAAFSVGSLGLVDALVLIRLVSFWRWKAKGRHRAP